MQFCFKSREKLHFQLNFQMFIKHKERTKVLKLQSDHHLNQISPIV